MIVSDVVTNHLYPLIRYRLIYMHTQLLILALKQPEGMIQEILRQLSSLLMNLRLDLNRDFRSVFNDKIRWEELDDQTVQLQTNFFSESGGP